MGTQIFLSSYASGLKEVSFDVTEEHFMPSGSEQKGTHQSSSFAFMLQGTERKDPEERAHYKSQLDPEQSSLSWLN